ncbi:MAG: alpha-ketoacid dehydrogenase subunit alpha/beta [Fibrobacterota bacterium]
MKQKITRFPERYTEQQLYPVAYRYMYMSRKLDELFFQMFKKGQVKGTVILSNGSEATTVGMGLPFRPGKDVLSLLHRDIAAHLTQGAEVFSLICQYMANAESPTFGREGNVHHGNAKLRRFPMISHLGNMLAPTVGGTWAARFLGENVFGLCTIGDGGSSTGDFHESLNFASARNIPVLFLIENNEYAYSTPTHLQYNCEKLSDRAVGYGIKGITIDGTDVWQVYSAVCDALEHMEKTSLPYLIESCCLRLEGHAAYDQAEYVSDRERREWMKREPVALCRQKLLSVSGVEETEVRKVEREIELFLQETLGKALKVKRPDPTTSSWDVYAPQQKATLPAYENKNVKVGAAVTQALDYIMRNEPAAFLLGQDIGVYGSAFKTCKGLFATHGPNRVLDTPICESATCGFALGASQVGGKPIVEFQFADFSTEAVTQIGLNASTWFFRSHQPAPILFRLPNGGGITLGAFHSGEFEGLWSRFPGLRLLYPVTAQEMFEALVAGFYDPNPCLVFEHKRLYWAKSGDIAFDGNLKPLFHPRKHREGSELTIIAFGAALYTAMSAAKEYGCDAEIWNPFILHEEYWRDLAESVKKTGRLLVVQESGKSAGLGTNVISFVIQNCFSSLKAAPCLVAAPDVPVPFARELENVYLPDKKNVIENIAKLLGGEA